jgi:hypothetical protein
MQSGISEDAATATFHKDWLVQKLSKICQKSKDFGSIVKPCCSDWIGKESDSINHGSYLSLIENNG